MQNTGKVSAKLWEARERFVVGEGFPIPSFLRLCVTELFCRYFPWNAHKYHARCFKLCSF
jgi:hypothetical protein